MERFTSFVEWFVGEVVGFLGFMLNGFLLMFPFLAAGTMFAVAAALFHPQGALAVILASAGVACLYFGRATLRLEFGGTKTPEERQLGHIADTLHKIRLELNDLKWRVR